MKRVFKNSVLVLELYFNMDPYCYNFFHFLVSFSTCFVFVSREFTEAIV
jgi:hypothetical protein